MSFKTLDTLPTSAKIVLLRADLNVPMQDGKVTDTTRLDRLVPTVTELSGKGLKVVILSHFGRPKGIDPSQSLRPVAERLATILGKSVAFGSDCVGDAAAACITALPPGGIAVLENLRFYKQEEANDAAFAAQLAALGDVYVNDAFSAAHRAHASTEALAHLLPAYAGRLMEAELTALSKALDHPERPVAAFVGGAKISTKLDLLQNLLRKVDVLALGGGMANTFLACQGIAVGKSLQEPDMHDTARAILAEAKATGKQILLPSDVVVAREFKAGAASETVPVATIPADSMALDIGPASAAALSKALEGCKTLVWNGPMGAFEIPPFDQGTVTVAKAAAALTQQGRLLTVGGGGDTVAALAAAGVEDKFSYISTAGGAFLEWLEGKILPGVAALRTGR
jgi:phosphoglycerate kinase